MSLKVEIPQGGRHHAAHEETVRSNRETGWTCGAGEVTADYVTLHGIRHSLLGQRRAGIKMVGGACERLGEFQGTMLESIDQALDSLTHARPHTSPFSAAVLLLLLQSSSTR